MKVHIDRAGDFRDAMHAVRMMNIERAREPASPACRLTVRPGEDAVDVVTVQRHSALRMRVQIDGRRSGRGETTLPALAVRTLCQAPATGPLSIAASGPRIEAVIGQARRRAVFDAPGSGHEAEACRSIMDRETRNVRAELTAGRAGEQLHRLGRDAGTIRVSMGPQGVRAWPDGADEVEGEPGAVLTGRPVDEPATVFGVSRDLLARALAAATVTLRTGTARGCAIELTAGTGRIVLAPAGPRGWASAPA